MTSQQTGQEEQTTNNLKYTDMKYFKIFEMMRCYCESKSDRCENCRLTQAVKAMPNGIDENAAALVMNVLDPAWDVYGKPIKLIEGFRCPVRNRCVSGNYQSQHVKGEAADICADGLQGKEQAFENLEIAKAIVKNGNYDMLILEDVPSDGVEPKWIHVSWKRNGENRKVIMKKVCGKDSCEELSKLDRMQLEAD